MTYSKTQRFLIYILLGLLFQCKTQDTQPSQIVPNENLGSEASPGGNNTVVDASVNAFGNSFPALSSENIDVFEVGNSFFRNNWIIAPSSTTLLDGLGPLLNAASCSGCHSLDGRGKPNLDEGLLFRLSMPGEGRNGEPLPVFNYGGQLNHKAIVGVDPEGSVDITYNEVAGAYPDGNIYSLRHPTYTFTQLKYGPMPSNVLSSPRVGQQVYGLGLLEAVTEDMLLAAADPSDANGDGISGKINYVWNQKLGRKTVGKYGWKANQPTLEQQVAGAFVGDMGIISSLNPSENLTDTSYLRYRHLPNGGNPEISDLNLQKVIFYQQTLAVPARRNMNNADVIDGKALFSEAQCQQCHQPKMNTETHPTLSFLSNQVIFPYSDLLLHDMGSELADGRPDFLASGNEWRTPPLWGIGLVKVVNGHTFFLHDGRARSLEEAILWHGGEAEISKNKFKNMSEAKRKKIIAFLESL